MTGKKLILLLKCPSGQKNERFHKTLDIRQLLFSNHLVLKQVTSKPRSLQLEKAPVVDGSRRKLCVEHRHDVHIAANLLLEVVQAVVEGQCPVLGHLLNDTGKVRVAGVSN